MTYVPTFVTETDDAGRWYDCTWASALMLAQKATFGEIPATRAEREALEVAGVGSDRKAGATLYDVSRATQVRYGWPTPVFGFGVAELLSALSAGSGAILQGLYAKLPANLTRWDPAFARDGSNSGHAVYVQDARADGTLLWMDPLGRNDYRGERIPTQTAMTYAFGLGWLSCAVLHEGEHARSKPLPVGKDPMIVGGGLVRTSNYVKALRKGQPLYQSPAGALLTTLGADASVEYYGIAGSGWHAVEVVTSAQMPDGQARPIICYVPAASGVVSPKQPPEATPA